MGPTAAGKSALALSLAPRIGAEIVSVDSGALYRGMDVGTDKPAADDRRRVPHHMLDTAAPDESPTVADFQRAARRAVDGIRDRGKIPLLVGGSGLYFRAVVDPLEFPGTDPAIRAGLEAEAAKVGAAALHRRLQRSDPQAAQRIEPANVRRTIRALEVLELTGRPFSSFRTGWDERRSIYPLRAAGLQHPYDVLDARIDARIDRQIAEGWVQEVARLRDCGVCLSATSLQVLGYAQILGYLDGKLTLEQAADDIKLRTRRFARRQMRWFRADPRIRWFEDAGQAAEYLADRQAGGE